MIFLWQNIPEAELVDLISKVLPWSPIVYSIVPLLLLIGCILFYKNWRRSEEYNKKRDHKTLEFSQNILALMIKIETRLNDQQKHGDELQELLTRVESINRDLSFMRDQINKK